MDVDLSGVDYELNNIGTAIGSIDISKLTEVGGLACCIAGVAIGVKRFVAALAIFIAWEWLAFKEGADLDRFVTLLVVLIVSLGAKWLWCRMIKLKTFRKRESVDKSASGSETTAAEDLTTPAL